MSNAMLDHWRGMLAYETWANERAIASLESVPESARTSPAWDRAVRLIPHNQLARQVWLWRLSATAYESPREWFPAMSPAETRRLCATVDALWGNFFEALAGEAARGRDPLAREVRYTSSEGRAYVSRVDEIVAHVLNHSTYHRGQVARLVAECGGQRASTDLIAMTRREV